ncbi:MAG: glucosamine-6-phosphate deaminase [Lachnospiraceae bacterium]|nr:glucosamine-6-phosphate deaminase [Lachnospiraceae bacterium]
MRVYCEADYDHVSRVAANIIAAQIMMKPDCVLGLATGSTPIGTYGQLIRRYREGDLDFSQVHSINLDEYRGLSPENDQSYRYFMNKHLFDSVNIDKKNTFVPDGMEEDREKACRDYDGIIRSHGGIDMQILGLGHNGHIGFNEPDSVFEKGTHCVQLTESTISANARFFASADEVPKEAYTMGIQSIMQAKKIVVIVSGESKKEIVKKAFMGPVTPQVPASVLQLHSDVILVGDKAALSEYVG